MKFETYTRDLYALKRLGKEIYMPFRDLKRDLKTKPIRNKETYKDNTETYKRDVHALTRTIENRQMYMYAWNSSVRYAFRDSLQSRILICLEETLKRLMFALKRPRNKNCTWKRDHGKKPRGFLHALQTECALCSYMCCEVRDVRCCNTLQHSATQIRACTTDWMNLAKTMYVYYKDDVYLLQRPVKRAQNALQRPRKEGR